MDAKVTALRHQIGVEKLMWGSDYPHMEGTWPHTTRKLAECFADVPKQEAWEMLSGVAARVYGFDLKRLGEIASEVGPTADAFGV